MKKAELQIFQEEVFNEVRMQTAYQAANTPTIDTYEKAVVTAEKEEKIHRWWYDVCTNISMLIKDYCVSHHSDTFGYTAELCMPDQWEEDSMHDIKHALMAYAEDYILAMWMKLIGHQKWSEQMEISTSRFMDAATILNSRKHPVRRKKENLQRDTIEIAYEN